MAALELTDPDDTPKNTLLRAIRCEMSDEQKQKKKEEYEGILAFILGDGAADYLKEIK